MKKVELLNIKNEIWYKQRFSNFNRYAAFTFGCPANIYSIDRNVFKKDDTIEFKKDKSKLKTVFRDSF